MIGVLWAAKEAEGSHLGRTNESRSTGVRCSERGVNGGEWQVMVSVNCKYVRKPLVLPCSMELFSYQFTVLTGCVSGFTTISILLVVTI